MLILVVVVALIFLALALGFLFIDDFNVSEPPGMEGGSVCSPTGGIDEKSWNNTLESKGGVFSGYGDEIKKAAHKHGIDPVLMLAIALHETANGTSDAVTFRNNPGGLMNPDGSGLMIFDTLGAGLESMANTLHNRIVQDGLNTIEKLGEVYAPLDAANDPTGLNQHWVPIVKENVASLGGLTMECETTNVEIIGDQAWVLPFTKHITSCFGERWGRPHNGIDIAFPGVEGQSAAAFMDGKVVVSEFNNGGYGNLVVLQHDNNIKTYYAHMSKRSVPAGTKVKAGQEVGRVGNTGASEGAHLHFEIRVVDEPTNPLPFLKDFNLTFNAGGSNCPAP